MPNNSKTTWIFASCKGKKLQHQTSSSQLSSADDITFVKVVKNTNIGIEKQKRIANLTQAEWDIITSPTGWLDCTIVQEAHVLLAKVNPLITGFQRPTLGPIRQFDIIMITEFVQLVHVNNNHWVCFSSIGCVPGHVNLLNSLA